MRYCILHIKSGMYFNNWIHDELMFGTKALILTEGEMLNFRKRFFSNRNEYSIYTLNLIEVE